MDDERPRGSGRTVDDFSTFCEGDTEPTLNKKIRTLIDATEKYIVYLDEDLYVEWSDLFEESPAGFEETANRIGHLETLSITQLCPVQREPFARLLGEAMARILGDKNEKEASAALHKAEAFLDARGIENARRWYLQGVGAVASLALLVALALWLVRNSVSNPTWLTALEVAIAASTGSLGALLSIASRTERIHLEPVAGPKIHRFEGATRVIVGVGGALFVAIAVKADLLAGVIHSLSHPFLALITICVISGASERLVPGLIGKMEKSFTTRSR
jgi:hypothetical protein